MKTKSCVIAVFFAAFAGSALAQNLVTNGNFLLPAATLNGIQPGDTTSIPGWTVDTTPDGDGLQFGAAAAAGNSEFGVPNNGGGVLQLTGGKTYGVGGGISQTIATTPGTVYYIFIDVASRGNNVVTGNFQFGTNNAALTASNNIFAVQSFTATASASSTLIDISGYTNSASRQLIINNVIVVSNNPSIVTPPANATSFAPSGAASFSATAVSTAPLSYQWYFNTNTLLPGATNSTLTLANLQSTNAGGYSIVVSNALGTATSSVATLTLLANVVLNPGFEQPVVSPFSGYGPGDSTDIPNWTVDSALQDGVVLGAAGTFGPSNGTQNLLLTGDTGLSTGGGVSQTIPTTPGMVYTILIDVGTQYGFYISKATSVAGQFNFGGESTTLNASSNATFKTLSFQVTALASSTLIDITGSTNSSAGQLVIDNVIVAATPGAGSKPSIITQPSSSFSAVNDSPSFTVAASGLQPFSYQWYYNTNTPLANATNNTLTLGSVQFTNAGIYSVVVSNSLGSITSAVATLNIGLDVDGNFQQTTGTANGIQPGDTTTIPGWAVDTTPDGDGLQLGAAAATGNSEFGVANNGGAQLQLTGGKTYAVGGGISQTIATTPGTVYTISIDVASRGGNAVTGNFSFGGINTTLAASTKTLVVQSWTVLASSSSTLIDISGYTNSSSRQLIINNIQVYPTPGNVGVKPGITQQPGSATNFNGATANFGVTSTGTQPLSYQWLFNQTNIAAATGPTLTVVNLQNSNAGSYSVIVTNQFGSVTSAVAVLTVALGKPAFASTNQTNQFITNYAGGIVNLAPVVNGTLPFSYQWYLKSNSLSAAALAGQTNSSLVYFPTTTSESGAYSIVVTNIFGAITGTVATLTVLPNQTLNWGFEAPNLSGGYQSLASGSTNLADWSVDTNAADPDGVQWGFATAVANVPNNGTQIIQLTGGASYSTGGGVSQMINTTPGQPYMISIDVASRQGNSAMGQFDFDTNAYTITATANPFTTISWPVVASGTNTLIDIIGAANSGSAQLAIDNVLVIPFNPAIAISSDRTNIILGWTFGSLQEAGVVNGPYTNVVGATSPWTNAPPLAKQQYYRLTWP